MMRHQSVGGEEWGAKTEGEKKEKEAEKMGSEKAEPFFRTKPGSVFPAKRKSVKKMVCECIYNKCSKLVPPTASNSKKETSIHPSSSELVHDTEMAD